MTGLKRSIKLVTKLTQDLGYPSYQLPFEGRGQWQMVVKEQFGQWNLGGWEREAI